MKEYPSLKKLDNAIVYILELASSLSVLLLAFGLVASVANVLTGGTVITHNSWMQQAYAWTQAVAVDTALAGVIVRTFLYYRQKQWIKMWIYAVLSLLLLYTALIISTIESIQQTLNISLGEAYAHIFVPVEVLIWTRSFAVILIILAHSVKYIDLQQDTSPIPLTPENINRLVSVQQEQEVESTVKEIEPIEEPKQLPDHTEILTKNQHIEPDMSDDTTCVMKVIPPKPSLSEMKKREAEINKEKVSNYLKDHPEAKVREVAKALNLSLPTVRKYMK